MYRDKALYLGLTQQNHRWIQSPGPNAFMVIVMVCYGNKFFVNKVLLKKNEKNSNIKINIR